MGSPVGFALVAAIAGAGGVAPGITAAPAAGNDVIQREIIPLYDSAGLNNPTLNATINAAVSVSA
jgi:hypothetical protein